MTKTSLPHQLEPPDMSENNDAKSLLPHNNQKGLLKPFFYELRHKSDTQSVAKLVALKRMRPPSEPAINKNNDKEWFIYWNHDVPYELWDKYPRKRIRIIGTGDNINRFKGEERERYAEQRRLHWKYNLEVLKYNPFEEDLLMLEHASGRKVNLAIEIKAEEQRLNKQEELSEEDKRKLTPIDKALEAFMDSRRARKLEKESISAYQGLVDWVYEGLQANEFHNMPVGELKHIHLSAALDYIAEDREWVATTINKGIEFLMTLLNWLETDEYITKNPSKGKFIKLPTYKTKHRWYDREVKKIVKEAVLKGGADKVYRAMQFTYFLLIRSKKELRKLKIGDIDQTLKRVRFRADLSKTKTEEYRDYPEEFQTIINEMKLAKYPADWYVFGNMTGKSSVHNEGDPGPHMVGHNYFSKQFKPIKDALQLSPDYTIYGMKHTRIVHEVMKGTEGEQISYIARHTDRKSTNDYMRDYDITLKNVYEPQDLTF